jgi:hypothetical protein
MNTLYIRQILMAIMVLIFSAKSNAQCGAGFTSAAINFDMQYLTSTLPASPVNYMFGKNSMRFAWSRTGTNTNTFAGITGAHTASGSGFGIGNDLKFDVNIGADTMVFDDEVTNLRFSVYDIDIRQNLTVTARNAAGTALNITMARVSGTNLTITGSGTTSALASTVTTTNIANTSTDGTANITIAGPVKTVILTFTKSSGTAIDSIYISDISACNNNSTTGVWPLNYQSVNTPDAGMPSFVLAAYKDSIMMVDLTNNSASLLYRDAAFATNGINSLAVDPYNQVIYYADNTRSATNLSIYKFDIKTRTKSTWVADVRTLGMQLYSIGLGGGGASFYDGDLYIGQDAGSTAFEPVSVYRIDINSSGAAVKATQFWSQQGNSLTQGFYDWSDFVINNGVFYNFNFARNLAAGTRIMHISMDTMGRFFGTIDSLRKSQASIDYAGNIYHMSNGGSELYNTSTGVLGALVPYTGTGSAVITDAGESFKPTFDYGDAPSSFGKAAHLFNINSDLMIGAAIDFQPRDTINAAADADDLYDTGSADDEDGVTTFPALTSSSTSYTINVRTTNLSGAAASLYGYIDFNRDGDFADAGERSTVSNVPNGTTIATPIAVNFTGLTGGSVGSSYIRFRIANSAAQASNYSGYAASGEVEDYPFPITASSLPVELISFKGELKDNNEVLLFWETASEINNDYFDIERKNKDNKWESIGKVNGAGNSNTFNTYTFTDDEPMEGENFYRLKQVDYDLKSEYSLIIMLNTITNTKTKEAVFTIFPNPVKYEISIKSDQRDNFKNTEVQIYNLIGECLYKEKMKESQININFSEYKNGIYLIKVGSQTFKIIKE